MATLKIDSEELKKITDRLAALEAENRALVARTLTAEQDIAQLRIETGAIREKTGLFP